MPQISVKSLCFVHVRRVKQPELFASKFQRQHGQVPQSHEAEGPEIQSRKA